MGADIAWVGTVVGPLRADVVGGMTEIPGVAAVVVWVRVTCTGVDVRGVFGRVDSGSLGFTDELDIRIICPCSRTLNRLSSSSGVYSDSTSR